MRCSFLFLCQGTALAVPNGYEKTCGFSRWGKIYLSG
jgi:hypothetical protein